VREAGLSPRLSYLRHQHVSDQFPASNAASDQSAGPVLTLGGLELHLARSLTTDSADYTLQGWLSGQGAELFWDGGSLQIQNNLTGLVEEAFFTNTGHFSQAIYFAAESDAPLLLALCDSVGGVVATLPVTVRQRTISTAADPGSPTLPRDLALEVLTRSGQRRKQILAPKGTRLPAKFSCVCRTTDQCGRIAVPLWEEERLLRQMTVAEIDPRLAPGSAVDIEMQIEANRAMTVRLLVRPAGRGEVVQVPPPPAARKPTPQESADLLGRLKAMIQEFSGHYGQELQARYLKCQSALQAALEADDHDKAAVTIEELQDLCEQLEVAPWQIRFPSLQRLRLMVKRCLFEAADLADRSGRDREQLFQQIYAQEQTAEQAHAEKNAGLYREAYDNLRVLADDLERLKADMTPLARRGPDRAAQHDVADALLDLQAYLSAVLPAATLKARADFVQQLQEIEHLQSSWAERGKREPAVALREVRKALATVAQMEQALTAGQSRTPAKLEGMLEGSG
jgi:hypothetical protein